MKAEDWHDIKDKLQPAFEMYACGHPEPVEELARSHPHLRREIEELLVSHLEMDTGFLSVAETVEEPEEKVRNSFIGTQLGPYLIIDQIGKGGMGEVYRAVRVGDQYRKQVAIKLIRAGHDSPSVVARFRNERHILASLEHPNIARLLDGGVSLEGIPYLVMEMVEGGTIHTYCDSHRLDTTERLRLFLQICNAVEYAHQRLIVHRDIKPSNILVNFEGVPKLLDFGIAKILNPAAVGAVESTVTLFRLLTPGYASPEQIRGETITTASDVYSLGVILYEMLTGHSPHGVRTRNVEEIGRAVCESDPDKPSTVITRAVEGDDGLSPEEIGSLRDGSVQKLRKRLRGDLDNIVLMALRKEPQRRYSSVELFAADIRRHLYYNLPVIARGHNRRYRARKFIARNKPAVLAACVVFLTLISALAVTLREAHVARTERARAEQRFRAVRELANSDLFELHDAIAKLPGSGSVRNLVIQRALKNLEQLSRDASGDHELMHELAEGYERIADLQGNFNGPGIGDTAAAVANYQRAIALRAALADSPGAVVAEKLSEVKTMVNYLRVLEVAGKTGEAARGAEKALTICNQLARERQLDPATQATLAGAHLGVSMVLGGMGSSSTVRKIPEAIKNDQDALSLLRGIQNAQDTLAASLYLKAQGLLAFHLDKTRRFRESQQIYDEAIASIESGPLKSPKLARLLTQLLEWRGLMLDRWGERAKALADFEAARAVSASLVKAEPDNLQAIASLQIDTADATVEKFRLRRADADIQFLNTAVATGERLLAANPAEHFYRNLLTGGYSYQGEIFLLSGETAPAFERYEKALQMAQSIVDSEPEDLESWLRIAKLHDTIGVIRARMRAWDLARHEFDLSEAGLRELLQLRPDDAEALYVSGLVQQHRSLIDTCAKANKCRLANWQLPSPVNG